VLHWVALTYSLAGRVDEALSTGRAALVLAEELGLDEIRANVLSTIGMTRTLIGDLGGMDDQERSVEIARAANSVDVIRSLGNLASTQLDFGHIARARETLEEAAVEAQRFGSVWYRDWIAPERATYLFYEGEWDAAVRVVDELVAAIEAGELTTFMEAPNRVMRARIGLARGDVDGALADLEKSVELGRAAKNPQLLHPVLAAFAAVQAELGRSEAAAVAVDEVLEDLRVHPVIASAFWVLDLGYAQAALGRPAELFEALDLLRISTPWAEAARAYASGDFSAAAAILSEIGSKPDAAYARMRSGVPAGVNAALEFYRSVGASRYVRECESLLATSRSA